MAISKLLLKTIQKIHRPAIVSIMPHVNGRYVMLDLGANTDCDGINLAEFAIIGYIEPHEIPNDKADVVVADGFSGNIALKSVEGTCHLIMHLLKKSVKQSFFAKLGLPFMFGAMRKMKKTMDPRLYNGAMFVGLNGLSVKSHGGTDAFGFSIAVENAARLVRKDFVGSIRRELENIDLDELSQEACYEVY